MKYLKVFLSIIYFILMFVISLWIFVKNMDNYSYIGTFYILNIYIHPFYFVSFIINLLVILIFSIILFHIKSNIIFSSILVLAISLNALNFIIISFLANIFQWYTGVNYSNVIIIHTLLLIIPIGLIILSIYLRDKYKKEFKKL